MRARARARRDAIRTKGLTFRRSTRRSLRREKSGRRTREGRRGSFLKRDREGARYSALAFTISEREKEGREHDVQGGGGGGRE